MYAVPEGYAQAIQSMDRTEDIYLSLGMGIDNTAADDITSITGSFLPMSNIEQATDAVYQLTPGLATFERDGIKTALSAGNIAPPLQATDYPPEAGIWSDAISDGEGNITFDFSISLSKAHTSAFRIFTEEMNITAGTVTFHNGTATETRTLECYDGYAQVAEIMTYDSIDVHVTKIDQFHAHVRIPEIEFGAAITLSKSQLTEGGVTWISEIDPLELTMPLGELDLSIINVLGDYDVDNPGGAYAELAIGYPIELSFTIRSGGQRYTVPCGQFIISEKKAEDNALRLTCCDPRWMLSYVYSAWSLPGNQSLGTTLDDLLSEYNVAHIVDEGLFNLIPEAAEFTDQTSILDDLLSIQQRYAVYFLPNRDGMVHVTQTWPADDYGDAELMDLYTWPEPQNMTTYNFVSIKYGPTTTSTYYQVDLRADSSESKQTLQISNPLILTSQEAQTLANRIIGRMYSVKTETDWRGDPALDLCDTIGIPGKWTQETPDTYKVIKTETTYDGALRMSVTATD